MSEFIIEPTCSETEITIEKDANIDIVAEVSHDAEVTVENIYEVEAQINEWQIVNDMIYVVQEFGEIPDWLETAINEILTDPNGLLVDSIEELKNLFDQFEEGYEARVISLENSDESQNTYISSLVSRTDDNAAAVIRIDSTYATKSYASATATEIVGAYLGDPELGGAWFESSVSAVADVAYSAARSSSSLNASITTNTSDIGKIYGTLDDISKQIDGKIVTWFIRKDDPGDGSYYDPIGPVINNGTEPNPDGKPYWCWLPGNICPEEIYLDDTDLDTRAEHTGDTYIWYENDANGNKVILSTWRFGKDPDSDDYNWFVFTDDLASEAYQAALNAQSTADGKINTFFQTWAPNLADAGLVEGDAWKMDGDIWYDATIVGYEQLPDDGGDDLTKPIYDGTMRRYDGLLPGGDNNPVWSGDNWKEVTDRRIDASVDRLDEATVTIGGLATAKGGLVTTAEGYVSGYVSVATNNPDDPGSVFKIFADKFFVAGEYDPLYPTSGFSTAPFSIETVDGQSYIKFNGIVEFDNPVNPLPEPDLSEYTRFTDLSTPITTTIIDGANIRTGFMEANRIAANTIWVDGNVRSNNYNYISPTNITGFNLSATSYWNIVGGRILGSYIEAGTLAASTIEFGGAKWASTSGIEYTGSTGYTWAGEMTYSAGSALAYSQITDWIAGPSFQSGYLNKRILSTSTSTCLVTASFQSHVGNGDVLEELQYNLFNGTSWSTTWTTIKSYRFYDNTLIFPVLQASVSLTMVPAIGAIRFRAQSTFNASFGAGRISISLDLRN